MLRQTKHFKYHQWLSIGGGVLLCIGLAAVVLYYSWNMALPDLVGAREMSFKNALGLTVFLAMAAAIVGRSVTGRFVGQCRVDESKIPHH